MLFFFISFLISSLVYLYVSHLKKVHILLKRLQVSKQALDNTAITTVTNLKGKIIDVNSKFSELFKYSIDEVFGKSHKILNSEFHDDGFWSELWATISQGQIWQGEIKNKAKDESEYWVRATISPTFDDHGNLGGYTSIMFDITDKKRAEIETEAAKNLAIQNFEARTKFLTNMSHEIRTPMNGIIGITDLLLHKVTDSEITDKLKIIKNCGDSLIEITNDILDFAKIEDGKMNVESISFNLNEQFQHVIQLFESKLVKKGLHFKLNMQDDVPAWVQSDSLKFKQILTNLIGNAIKFTSQGSIIVNVSINRPLISDALNEDELDNELLIEVRDSGIGISKEGQEKLFQSFSQVDASTTRKFGGSGLGLAITRGLVEVLHGRIWMDSEEKVGTSFFFTFPYKKTNIVEQKQASPSTKVAYKKDFKILVAEDNRVNQYVIQGYLERLGLFAEYAIDGAAALDKASIHTYDLIFMDCQMPRMDGFEATRRIKALRPQSDTKIVALTASATVEDRKKCLESGMEEVIAKPIRFKDIIDILKPFEIEGQHHLKPNFQHGETHIDISFLQDELAESFDLLKEATPMICTAIKASIESMKFFIEKDDFNQVALQIHMVKDSLSYFHISNLKDIVQPLADAVNIEDPEASLASLEAFKSFYTTLEYELLNLKNLKNSNTKAA